MDVTITSGGPAALGEYSRVPIAFEVRTVLDCELVAGGLGGLVFSERRLERPYAKDYDALEGEVPTRWASRFDISRWRVFLAHAADEPIGGAVVVFNAPGVRMLEAREDLALLWDLRVRAAERGRGVGSALLEAAAAWAAGEGAREIKVETQNTNVPACRFYAARGCALGAINRFAYGQLPAEVQLLWYKPLAR